MKPLKFNSNAGVRTVCERLQEHLGGIAVAVLTPQGDVASPDAKVETVRTAKAKTGEFTVPSFKTHVGTFEEAFKDHFGFSIDLLMPDGSPVLNEKSLKWACDAHQRDRTESPFADWLQKALADHKLTQADLASRAGIAPVTVDNLYNGYTLTPRRDTSAKIEAVLGPVPAQVLSDAEADNELSGIGRFSDADLTYQPGDGQPDLSGVPDRPGVYILYSGNGSIVYVGMSGTSILKRIRSHSEKKWFMPPFVSKMAYVEIPERKTALAVEGLLIKVLGKRNLLANKAGAIDLFGEDE